MEIARWNWSHKVNDVVLKKFAEKRHRRDATNDNDAIDADMHTRARDAQLILRATQRQSAVMMVVCYRI